MVLCNFLDVFHFVDKGHENLDLTTGYNGGLFAPDDEIDNLDLGDRWTDIFKTIGEFDFAEDVNVDVLGHIFEKFDHRIGETPQHRLLRRPFSLSRYSGRG